MTFTPLKGFSRYEISEEGLVRNRYTLCPIKPEPNGEVRLYDDTGTRQYYSVGGKTRKQSGIKEVKPISVPDAIKVPVENTVKPIVVKEEKIEEPKVEVPIIEPVIIEPIMEKEEVVEVVKKPAKGKKEKIKVEKAEKTIEKEADKVEAEVIKLGTGKKEKYIKNFNKEVYDLHQALAKSFKVGEEVIYIDKATASEKRGIIKKISTLYRDENKMEANMDIGGGKNLWRNVDKIKKI